MTNSAALDMPVTKIPLVDVAWQHRQLRPQLEQIFAQFLDDPACDGLEACLELEKVFAAYFGPEFHATSVQSGSAAEFLALKALGIGPGDEVITVPNSDMATTAAISHVGARFIPVDVDAQTHNLDPALVAAAITPRTRAIMPVHMYGLPAEMAAIRAIAEAHGLLLIEDATLALGAIHNGQKAGTWGDAAFFSFAPRKVLGAMGNGGMVLTRRADVAHAVRLYKGYGQDPAEGERPIVSRLQAARGEWWVEGHNLKLDPLQAAVVLAKFPHLDAWADLRQAAADSYARRLASLPDVQPPFVPAGARHAWRNYVVTLPAAKRAAVRAYLQAQGIHTSVLYTPPVHLQPVYALLGLGPGSFPVTETLADKLLSLPLYPGIDEAQIAYVVDTLAAALAQTGTATEVAA
jgi:dTDP-4-amino-4,6-dideoxygalactose transaminase